MNVYWHLGAGTRTRAATVSPGVDWIAKHDNGRPTKDKIEAGNFCPGHDATDPKYTTEYKFEHCTDIRVGYAV